MIEQPFGVWTTRAMRGLWDRPKKDALLAKLDASTSLTVLGLQAAIISHGRGRIEANRVSPEPISPGDWSPQLRRRFDVT